MKRAAETWNRFWFASQPASTLAAMRICVGGLAFASGLILWPDLDPFFQPTWLGRTGSRAVDLALVLAACCLSLGWRTRIAAGVTLLCLTVLARTNPFIFNSGDTLLRHLALVIAVAPSGAALSLDRKRQTGTAWAFPFVPVWPLRLVQVQVAVMYAAAVMHKLGGVTWWDGTATAYPLRMPDVTRFSLTTLVTSSVAAAQLMTWGTLAVEAAIPLLVWNRRCRPWVLGAGVALHLSIDLTLRAGLFSWVVLASYLSFVPPETMTRALSRAAGGRRRTAFNRETSMGQVTRWWRLVVVVAMMGLMACGGDDDDGGQRTFVGSVDNSPAAVAALVNGDTLLLYVCNGHDGKRIDATLTAGRFFATVDGLGDVAVEVNGDEVLGTVTADGVAHPFTAMRATGAAALLWAESETNGRAIAAGWIIRPDGTETGGAVRGVIDGTSNTLLSVGSGSYVEQDNIIAILIGLRSPLRI